MSLRWLGVKEQQLWNLVSLALLVGLLACGSQSPPALPIGTGVGYEFRADPIQRTLTLLPRSGALLASYLPSDTRILVPDVDIRLELTGFDYSFAEKKLSLRLRLENVTPSSRFLQPLFFTLKPGLSGITKARTPLVTDQQLGGSGLGPGEQSAQLEFEVWYEEAARFNFFVDTSAAVLIETKLPNTSAPYTMFGRQLGADSTTLAVASGFYRAFGQLEIFEQSSGIWERTALFSGSALGSYPDKYVAFERSLAVAADLVVVGDPDSHSVAVFEKEPSGWVKTATLSGEALERFGTAVSISGDTIFVSAPGWEFGHEGGVYVFDNLGGSWVLSERLGSVDSDIFSVGTQLAAGDDVIAVANYVLDYGQEAVYDFYDVYLFEKQASSWFGAPYPHLLRVGTSWRELTAMAVSPDTVVISGKPLTQSGDETRAVYLFEKQGVWPEPNWQVAQVLLAPDGAEGFGASIALEGERLLVAAPEEAGVGRVYVFERGDVWRRVAEFGSQDALTRDLFGASLALSADTAFIAAPGDDDHGEDSGSVYVYTLP